MTDPELVTVEPDTTDNGLIPLPAEKPAPKFLRPADAADEHWARALEFIANFAERTNQLYPDDRKTLRTLAEYLRTDIRMREL